MVKKIVNVFIRVQGRYVYTFSTYGPTTMFAVRQ